LPLREGATTAAAYEISAKPRDHDFEIMVDGGSNARPSQFSSMNSMPVASKAFTSQLFGLCSAKTMLTHWV
jgi:hypothetical protein